MSEALFLNKPTETLMDALSKADDIRAFIDSNSDTFINVTIAEALNNLADEKGLSKAFVIKRAELNQIFGYQLFAGSRNPSRNTLLCLCVGLTLTLEETQRLLKTAGLAPLYPKNKRDSIIIFGVSNSMSVLEINESLYNLGESTL